MKVAQGFLILLISSLCTAKMTSFFGDSYAFLSTAASRLKLKNKVLQVKLEFKTPKPDGLLVQVDGEKSLCKISLDSGRIKVRYKLKSMEAVEFWSPYSMGLYQLQWHSVILRQNGTEFSLAVDENRISFSVGMTLKRPKFGKIRKVFIGGIGGFYLSPADIDTPFFFGCVANVSLNGVSIFELPNISNKVEHNVGTNCDTIFDSESALEPTSFTGTDSFIGFDISESRQTPFHLNFDIRSSVSDGVLFHGLGKISKNASQDLDAEITLKIDNQNLLLLFESENTVTAAKSQLKLIPKQWNFLGLHQDPSEGKWTVTLDQSSEILLFPVPSFRVAYLFIGSFDKNNSKPQDHSAQKSKTAFSGCIQNFYYKFQRLSILNASVVRNIERSCKFASPCYSNPCPLDSECQAKTELIFQCLCQSERCSNSDSDSVSLSRVVAVNDEAGHIRRDASVDPDEKLLYINGPLVATEGHSSLLMYSHMVLYPQHRRYGLTSNNVVFRLLGKPLHGKLTIGMSRDTHDHKLVQENFTYEDLMLGRVNYTHDGSETREDRLEFEVEFRNLNEYSPSSMKEKRAVELPVIIIPRNDLPTLNFPTGQVIRLAENSKITVTQRQIQISDPDNAPRDVQVKIHFSTPDIGYFEDIQKPGLRLMSFTQDDLITGKLRFVHFGPLEGLITISVADLEGESERHNLRIVAFPIQLRMETRTPISVLHNSCEFITKQNLSFATNAATGQEVEIRYEIVHIPKFGRIEVQNYRTGKWELNASFNQSSVNQKRVRYCHTTGGQPITDLLKFEVSALALKSNISYDLEMVFVPVNIKVFNPNPFVLNNSERAILNRDHLFAWTFPKSVPADQILYRLTYPPKFGFLQKVIDASTNRNRRFGMYSNFTQADLDSNQVFFSLHMFPQYKVLNDYFRFKVITPIVKSEELIFEITYIPGNEAIKLINRTLIVREGSLQKITNNSIFLETPDDKEFAFILRNPALHGEFHVLGRSEDGSTRQIHKGGNFTSRDLEEGRVYYRHDNSETLADRAFFEATPLYRHRTQFKIKFWFQIRITLENDNAPERVFAFGSAEDAVFHVQYRGEKTATKNDLEFYDRDNDFDSDNLRYFFPEQYTDGGLFWKRQPDVPARNFTQKDIKDKRLIFRHLSKTHYFELPFYVTDGVKNTKSLLQVNASSPFLKQRANTGIVTELGAVAILGPRNLSMVTNLDAEDSEIRFRVLKQPKFGKLCLVKVGSEECERTDLFSQEDVQDHRVLYSHLGSPGDREDEIALMSEVGTLEASAKIHIRILAKNEKQKLKMENLKDLTVTERSLTEIGPEVLKATHPRYMPGSIRFYVISPPKYGTLFRARQIEGSLISGENSYFESFTQFHINSGELFYQHYESSAAADRFVFNVTAGDSILGLQVFKIKIVRHKVELTVRNFTAPAGGRIVLDRSILKAESSFHSGSNALFVYRVTKSPTNGWLRSHSVTPAKDHVTWFTSKELTEGMISYVHDGQSSWKDNFTVSASLTDNEKATQSENRTLVATILHENIREPELENNIPLKMYNNKWAVIGQNLLEFIDTDNPPEQLQYLVSPQNGYLAFNEEPTKPITEFSQKDINDKKIVFIRSSNGSTAGFTFIVSDGKHESERYWFSIEISDLTATLDANNRLLLPPASQYTIGMDLLRASIPNAQPRQIVFSVTRAPKFGRILLNGTETNIFTQHQINQRLVSYKQDRPVEGWLVKDSMWFVISLNGSNRFVPELEEEQRFKILISFSSISPERMGELIAIKELHVPQGGSLAINFSHINISELAKSTGESLVIRLVQAPRFGWLIFKGRNVSDDSFQFSDRDLADHSLVYQHNSDGNELLLSNDDDMILEVFPNSETYGRKRRNLKLRFKLPIKVLSASSNKLQIRAIHDSLRMVRGTTHIFGPEDLMVQGEHLKPSDILYSVIQGPKAGYFILEGSEEESVRLFTQAQINKRTVIFTQKGPDKEGSFTLRVSSGNFHPITRVVRLIVSPLTLSFVNASRITYEQGRTYVELNRSHLGADSNGPRENILYRITAPPQNGSFLWAGNDEQTDKFSQTDIDRGQVLYAQMKMEAWRDAFQFEISNSQNKIRAEKLEIRVLPGATQNPISVKPGNSVIITSQTLRVSEKLQDKAPVFTVVRPPRYGILYKILAVADGAAPGSSRKKREEKKRTYTGDKKREEIDFFTLEDLKMRSIEYENTLEKAHNPLQDHFVYELRANGVQPARGRFTIQILSQEDSGVPDVVASTPKVSPPSTTEEPVKPTMTENFMIVIYVVAGIIFGAFMFIIFRKVRISKERARRYEQEKSIQAEQMGPTPGELMESAVYASIGTRTSSFRAKNGLLSSIGDTDPLMFRSVTLDAMDRNSRATQMTPPPKFHTLNKDNNHSTYSEGAPRMVTFDPGRTEVISSVPMCKVTPLTPRSVQSSGVGSNITSSGSFDDYRYAYQYSSSASDTELKAERLSLDRATGYKKKKNTTGPGSHPPPTNKTTKLKENQYWV